MANIIITEKCNQNCPYCFASEVMEKKDPNITLDEFRKIMEFILRTDKRFGLIGGEPLLHPEIDRILEMVIDESRVDHVTIFTNGTHVDEHIRLLTHPKVALLVNFNSKNDVGKEKYEATANNLNMMFKDYRMGYKITLGLNIYSPSQDLDYFIKTALNLKVGNVRVSITVPPNKNVDYKQYFLSYFPMIKHFLATMNRHNIAVSFDCNLIPICLMDKDLKRLIEESERNPECGRRYVSTDHCSRCNPVIDISRKGVAIRCFGLSDLKQYSLWDYSDLHELHAVITHEIDHKVIDLAPAECKSCHDNKCHKCYGGCIAFRVKNHNEKSDW